MTDNDNTTQKREGSQRQRPPGYEQAKKLARAGDAEKRQNLADSVETPPEILYYLASDIAMAVRLAVAANRSTPYQAGKILCLDQETPVRLALVKNMAGQVASNQQKSPDPLHKLAQDILYQLSRDPSPLVRSFLAQALAKKTHAPYKTLRRLAFDEESEVACPVLQHAQQLQDEDLIAVLGRKPAGKMVEAIAKRKGLSAQVAHAITDADHVPAITHLLKNEQAVIREETLDRILDRAPRHKSWHKPLVMRRNLPQGAVMRLARFVAVSLLESLQNRPELDQQTAQEVAQLLKQRLENQEEEQKSSQDGDVLLPEEKDIIEEFGSKPGSHWTEEDEEEDKKAHEGAGAEKEAEHYINSAHAKAEKRLAELLAQGQITEDILLTILQKNDLLLTDLCLAHLTKLPVPVMTRIRMSRSPKAVVALAWKAGLPASLAVKLQLKWSLIAHKNALNPGAGGVYPLDEGAMNWQISFYATQG